MATEKQKAELIEKVLNGVATLEDFRKWRLARRLGLDQNSHITHHSTIAGLPENTLSELAEFFGLWSATSDQIWSTHGFRLFVSHVSDARGKLAELKASCEFYGINLFLAHDNIEEGSVWADQLRQALETMDAMLTCHSLGFTQSAWTGQEIGYALCRKVPIISLMDGEPPRGFLQDRQGFKWKPKEDKEAAAKIFSQLNQSQAAPKLVESLARKFQDAGSYNEADFLVSALAECPSISDAAAVHLSLVFKYNDQVYESNGNRLREVMAMRGHILPVMEKLESNAVDF